VKLPTWLVFVLGGAIGATALAVGQSFAGTVTIPDGLGDLLTGVGALAAGFIASAGLVRWETRHRAERRAEAAAQMIQVAWDVAQTLLRITNLDVPDDRLVARVRRNLRSVQDHALVQRLTAARGLCSVYIPDNKLGAVKTLFLIAASYEDFFLDTLALIDSAGRLPASERLTIATWLDEQPDRIETAYNKLRADLGAFALPP
jgi:hypothetical protein